MTTRQQLEATAARTRCAVCKTQARVAWLPMLPLQTLPGYADTTHPHEYRLRCECFPKGPTLEKLPKSELSKAIEDPSYGTDAVTRMQAERFREKRESKP